VTHHLRLRKEQKVSVMSSIYLNPTKNSKLVASVLVVSSVILFQKQWTTL
jgi:uncharacterized membrane protein YqhA